MTFSAIDEVYRASRLYKVIRFVAIIAAVVATLVVGAIALFAYSFSRATDEAQDKADSTVRQSAERYTSALQRVFGDGSGTTGEVLGVAQSAYVSFPGDAVAGGISLTGIGNLGRDVVVDFSVTATYGGGFNQGTTSDCFRVDLHRTRAGNVQAAHRSIECHAARPVPTSGTTFRVR